MKFYAKLAVAIAILVFVLWWLQNQTEEPKPVSAAATPAPVVQATPAQPPAPTPTPIVMTSAPDPGIGRAREIAQRMGLTFVNGRGDNGWLVVTVRARERNDLSDYLDELIKAGMKDLDVNNKQYHEIPQRDGRIIHEGVYRIRF